MAPTICSEKKPRQIRTNLKEIRRQPNAASALLMSSVAAASASLEAAAGSGNASLTNGNSNAPIASNIIKYVPGGRNSTAMRVRGKIDTGPVHKSFFEPLRMDRLHMAREPQISDNVVSSSTTGPELLLAITAGQMDLDNDITDEEDCEVHSITSGAHCRSNITSSSSSGYSSASNTNFPKCELHQCTDNTVFTAPTLHDKQSLPPHASTANKHNNSNNNYSYNHHKRPYASDEAEHDSDTYSSLREIENTEGLLAIALKTIKLVKRNQMLQRRLAQLQLETSEFIQSVLANPENRHFRDKMQSPSSPSVMSATSPTTTPLAVLQSPSSTTATTITITRQQSTGSAAEA